MKRLDVEPDQIKAGLGWAAEKAGRLKPNGHLLQFSPLSRLVEIEGLITGVSGKLSLWRALLWVAPTESRLDEAGAEHARRARGGPAASGCTRCARLGSAHRAHALTAI